MPFNTTSLSQSLSGLQILTAYDARVLSINANGPSDFSATTRLSTVGEWGVCVGCVCVWVCGWVGGCVWVCV